MKPVFTLGMTFFASLLATVGIVYALTNLLPENETVFFISITILMSRHRCDPLFHNTDADRPNQTCMEKAVHGILLHLHRRHFRLPALRAF